MSDTAERTPRPGRWACGLAAVGLLVAGALLHLGYLLHAGALDLSADEAHYWEWSRRLDISYYSKGPLVAYCIALGRWLLADCSLRLLGNETLAVRVPAIVLSLCTGLGTYALALGTGRSARLALASVALTFTIPILAVGAILMTIDAPLACCFVWALVLGQRGLQGPRLWPWVGAGLLIALGLLAKLTMVLIFPIVGLALLATPEYRGHLRRPGPYVAAVLGLLGLMPILIWNAQHGWVSFCHVAGQAGLLHDTTLDPGGVLEYLVGQAAVVSPVWYVAMLVALFALWRQPAPREVETHAVADVHLLICATLVPWLAFLIFSLITKVQPNWPAIGVLPAAVLLTLWLARRLRAPATRRATRGLVAAGALLGGGAVVLVHRIEWIEPLIARVAPQESAFNLTPVARLDPTARLRGWSRLGAAVGRHLAAERRAGRDPFIVTNDYEVASEIAFYCPGQPTTYALQAVLGGRQSQYDIWPNPIREAGQFVGRPCIYVGARKPELFGGGGIKHIALRGARLAETVEYRVRGHLYQVWPVYTCDEFAGLPPEVLQRGAAHF